MKRAIKAHATDVGAIIGLLVLAVVISVYVLKHEGLRFPVFSSTPFTDYVALQTGQAVTPGQGQSVRVSGVQIGTIGQISLVNGHAVAQIDIEPNFRNLIHEDATALLRPRTGLDPEFPQHLERDRHKHLVHSLDSYALGQNVDLQIFHRHIRWHVLARQIA